MNKKILFLITGLLCFLSSYSQCTYTGTPLTSVGGATPYTFSSCIGTPIITPNIRAGQFALVNVLAGSTYRFTVGNLFSDNENLTILDATTNASLAGGFNSNAGGVSIFNWVSPISGQIKVLVSRGSCLNNDTVDTVGTMTMVELVRGNATDDQTALGVNQWVGHVYSSYNPGVTSGASPGGDPSPNPLSTSTNPFITANYEGFYTIPIETISEGFGSNTACFPITKNGAPATIYTETFAVRYRMRSTRPAGCYILNVNGDDGIRVYVDGVLVFDRWKEQGNTSYCNNLINLTGNSVIVLDYYENAGGNVLGFSLAPFDGSGNTISSASNVALCSNGTTTITGSNLISCNVNTNTAYQWQSSTDNTNFSNISGATSQNYNVPAVAVSPGAANNVRYFRRIFRPTTLGSGTCEFFTSAVTVTTSGDRPNGPGAITGNTTQCRTTSSSYSIAAVTNAAGYAWSTTATGWTITPAANGLSVSIAFGPTATSGNLIVFATNGCGQSFSSSSISIQVGDLPTNATISGSASVCVGAVAPVVTISNPQAYNVNVTYNINGGTNVVVALGANASVNITNSTSTTGNFIYNLVNVSNPSSANCSTNLTGSATVTVGAAIGDKVSYGNNSWIGYVYPGANPENSDFNTNFAGSISQLESFDLNLDNAPISGTGICGSYADNYAVRFKMNRNLQAGCYTFIVGADDGYRLSLDGGATFVINDWTAHSYREQTYVAYLSGNTNFVLEYFEAAGQARVKFSSSFVPLEKPIVATTVQPNCITPTGSVRLTGLPSGSWTLIRSGSSNLSIVGTGLETTISGLAPGTYAFAITSGSCTTTSTGNVVIDAVKTTTYTAGNWSIVPTIDMIGVINSNTPITTDVQLCNCTVNTGINAVVSTGVSMKLQDKLTVNGMLTFENNASLVQVNDVANTGNITYQRETTPIKRFDYTYWSSPVLSQKLIDVSPNTNLGRFYSFDPVADNYFAENPNSTMKRGVGYIIRAPEGTALPPAPLSTYLASFIGVPDNGPVSTSPVVANKPYLIGNPYPSAIDADKFLAANSSVLFGTLYFWTHNTARGQSVSNPGTGFYAYSADDYAAYNSTGGIAVAASDPDKSNTNPFRPTGKIAAGQSFFASSLVTLSGTSIVFNNGMRIGTAGSLLNNSQFFRTTSGKTGASTEIEKNRVWLNLTNTQGAFKQLLVGYLTGATNDYDTSYDGTSFNGNEFIDFYSLAQDKTLTIQGRALPFDENDVIPLGYSSTLQGTFSISIDEVDGVFSTKKIYLEDKKSGGVHDLTSGAYSFQTEIGTFNDRFVLRYTNKTLANPDFELLENGVFIAKNKNELRVKSQTEMINQIVVFDLLGRKIFDKTAINATDFQTSIVKVSGQVVIVKVVLANGKTISKKIIY